MTIERFKPLLDKDFLKAELTYEFTDYKASGEDARLRDRLEAWSRRELKRETQAEASFVQRFFIETWGYRDDGAGADTFHLHPKFPIAGAGQTGNRGEADLAVGNFTAAKQQIPQVVCEFKDIKSALDAPQNRKGNNRSPVMQARDYLWNARRGLFGSEPVQPRFAIVTDMDEFRLYWWDNFPDRYLRFTINKPSLFAQATLLDSGDEAQFDRFLFWRLFRPDMLLSDAGRTRLERLIEKQGKASKRLEGAFYDDYRAYREVLIANITVQRPEGMTKGGAVRLAQKLLDRFIFVMFAEDMGSRVGFPVNALKEQLERYSGDKLLRAEGNEVWERLKLIFDIMDKGGDLGEASIHNFNGGLFADDTAINALDLPNRLFVRFGQARNDAKLAEHKDTLLYLAATYNFASEGDARNSVGLYTLGHIFEQSIVELEKLEADAEGRTSLTDVTKRKRDGVYYTPEWVVTRIIEETIDPLFVQWKAAAGWPAEGDPSVEAASAYWQRLQRIKVIDPACGSGAFLIVALRHLQREFEAAAEAAYATKAISSRVEAKAITRHLLANNLFGVDINPASVEITQLSLWLHTAEAKEPLSSLRDTIQCGNSLVDKRFYAKRDMLDADGRDRINTFDWEGKFASGSFDAVIGNPPYVEKKNLLAVNADMATWLEAGSDGNGPYKSTTRKWDLYLPFIEKGLMLLNETGRMGYIAPNLWPTLENGEGLRTLVHAGRHLEKWLDFRSHQVFEEATVYTAIQIYSKQPAQAIQLAFAGDGDISRVDWTDRDYTLAYGGIAVPANPWLLAPAPVKRLVERLGKDATRLDDPINTNGIIVGVQATVNDIYHLRRLSKNRYVRSAKKEKGKSNSPDELVEIEDGIMRALISGTDAKRFISPNTNTFLLFPYDIIANKAILLDEDALNLRFPLALKYLSKFEKILRKANDSKHSDKNWMRYTYPKNLARQSDPKLIVAQLVPELRLAFDDQGEFCLDNVRVNGVLPRRGNGWFLLAVLNSPISNYIFKWLGKPKDGGYFEANKQFIAPLPVPSGSRGEKAAISALAKEMQERSSERVLLKADLKERLAAAARVAWPLEHLLPDVRAIPAIEQTIPRSVPSTERKRWVDEQRAADEESALARIDGAIRIDSRFDVRLARGKLSFLIDEQEVARVFVSEDQEALVAAQWRAVSLDFQPGGRNDAKRLIDQLRKVVVTATPALAAQIIEIGAQLASLSEVIQEDERQLHELTALLFNLSDEEERLVLQGRV